MGDGTGGGGSPWLRIDRTAGPDGRPCLRLVGELDLSTADDLSHHLEEVDGDVVIDGREVSFCDSQGLGRLLDAARRLEEVGARITLVPSDALRRTVELAGVGTRFDLDA